MTNELEKQFFDTFGIEPTHEDACKLADKYWGNEKLAEEYYVFERYMEKNCPIGGKECFATCKYAYDNIEYPQITDRILLGIIAKIMWSYSCTQNDFDAYEVHTVDNLKEAVLKHAIELSKNDAYVYWGVRTLFEEKDLQNK